jgi:hypothetical protein
MWEELDVIQKLACQFKKKMGINQPALHHLHFFNGVNNKDLIIAAKEAILSTIQVFIV